EPSATKACFDAASNEMLIAPPNASRLALFGGNAGAPPRPRPPRPPPRPARPVVKAIVESPRRPPPARLTPAYAVSGLAAPPAAAGESPPPSPPVSCPLGEIWNVRVPSPPLPPIQMSPFGSIARPLAVVGHSVPCPAPPQCPTTAPLASYSSTAGAAEQHSPVG